MRVIATQTRGSGRRPGGGRLALATALAFLVCAAPAGAHAVVRIEGNTLTYASVDAVSVNTVTIAPAGAATTKITDPTVAGGIDPGPCVPVNQNEVDCPSSRIGNVNVDVADRDDQVTIRLDLPSKILGGTGNDTISSAGGNDTISGEDGNDKIDSGAGNDTLAGFAGEDSLEGGAGEDVVHGGAGADTLGGGEGNDDMRSRDGVADQVSCGAGQDRVSADFEDALPEGPEGCEAVDRQTATGGGDPGPEGTEAPSDRTPPLLTVGGSTLQSIGRRRRTVTVVAAASEAGTVTATFRLAIAGSSRRLRLGAIARPIALAGAGARFRITLRSGALNSALRAMRRGRRASVVVDVRARDRAGNATQIPARRTIRLGR